MSENQSPESNRITRSNDPAFSERMSSTARSASGMSGSRPGGLTLLAILSAVSGFVGLCCPGLLLASSTVGILIPTGVTQIVGILGILLSIFLGFGPLLQIVFAYGAWNLRPWAWVLGVVAMGLSVLGVLVNIIGSGGSLALTAVTNGIVPILILIYLLLPDTRKSFNL